jgi:hypothetical protein
LKSLVPPQQQPQPHECESVAQSLDPGQAPGEGEAEGKEREESGASFRNPGGALEEAEAGEQRQDADEAKDLGNRAQADDAREQGADHVEARGIDTAEIRCFRHLLDEPEVG